MKGAQSARRKRSGKAIHGGTVNKIGRDTVSCGHSSGGHARLEQNNVFAGNGARLGEHVKRHGQKEQTGSDP